MPKKALEDIKHGQKVVNAVLNVGNCFILDIQRASGLDPRTLRTVVNRLYKNGFLAKNEHGQWSIPDS